ncbi:MAG: SiaB family protein kinase [Bacteroidales bacterium]|nr:SiaB family protein kinase [Bacteroidales bacterium]MDD3891236.1 SiaB family protein kinase [Bacteroidales bacterium]
MSLFLEQCFEKMNQGEVIVAYKGNIDSNLIANTLSMVELKLENFDVQNIIKKKLYNVLVESLQNLYHHVDTPLDEGIDDETKSNFGVFILNKFDNGFRISTGNFVHKDKVEIIKGKIDKINALSAEELKEFYKFVLNNQKFSEKGGGGLGLIDMARKTGNKLQYNFFDYNKTYLFFNLTVFINF